MKLIPAQCPIWKFKQNKLDIVVCHKSKYLSPQLVQVQVHESVDTQIYKYYFFLFKWFT